MFYTTYPLSEIIRMYFSKILSERFRHTRTERTVFVVQRSRHRAVNYRRNFYCHFYYSERTQKSFISAFGNYCRRRTPHVFLFVRMNNARYIYYSQFFFRKQSFRISVKRCSVKIFRVRDDDDGSQNDK